MRTLGSTITAAPGRAALWAGRVVPAVPAAFMIFDGVLHIAQPVAVNEAFVRLGWPLALSPLLGALELCCTSLYVWRATSAFGAVLLTGYLGGAVATHLRAGSSTFEMLFPMIVGALCWSGVILRDPRARLLLPFARR